MKKIFTIGELSLVLNSSYVFLVVLSGEYPIFESIIDDFLILFQLVLLTGIVLSVISIFREPIKDKILALIGLISVLATIIYAVLFSGLSW